ncbi:MAG: UDP-N-acetylglucosamine 1-carboxyvinyltransferase [Chloroflexi bacterium]|nr:UDP-N-acetylglucosamine 1-carboxyvinyltransferase [Chloroflexota bacterium]
MERFIVEGGHPIQGTYRPAGNKNAALPMLAACLLTDQPVTLHRVPRIDDVRVQIDILTGLGVDAAWDGDTLRLDAAGLNDSNPDPEGCRKIRASVLLAGPLGIRCGHATLPLPGGDIIGRRRLDTHLTGLKALGFEVALTDGLHFTAKTCRAADLILDEASVTATENLMMAAALIPGTTTLYHAACEPHVEDLGRMLRSMGASIEGLGTNSLTIHGVAQLGGTEFTIQPDYVEAGSFAMAAAVTGGDLVIDGWGDSRTTLVLGRGLRKLGMDWSVQPDRVHIPGGQDLAIRADWGGSIPTLEDGIWPAFPSDLLSVAIVVATQARGTLLVFEKLFESRLFFVDRLIEMGAHIIQCDPHRVVVQGPQPLTAVHMSSPDIRAGVAMVVAALCAEGRSVIDNADKIDRGYVAIDERLRALGGVIERETG